MDAQIHFLRPEWLWSILPSAWIIWKLWHRSRQNGTWNQLIDANFQPILLGEKSEKSQLPWPVLGLGIIWLIAIIALSGPSWKKVDVPAEKSRQGTVILLDLSLSMLADDLKPNRLTRTRFSLIDLLKAHPEHKVGMVAYAATAHAIAPVSEDNQTLLSLLPSLSPLMMPEYGANALAGFQKAAELLTGAKIKQGHILWVTDDIENSEIDAITTLLKQKNLTLSILVVGTPHGAPIQVPEYGLLKTEAGKIIVAKVPFERFQNLAEKTHSSIQNLSMAPTDINNLMPSNIQASLGDSNHNQADKSKPQTLSAWLDEGVYLLLLLLPLVAIAYRRGWVLVWAMVASPLMLFHPEPSFAETAQTGSSSVTLIDVFKSPDQQGYEKWQQHDYSTANDRFESSEWKGASLYRLGKFNEAAQQFSQDNTAMGHYNHGNALARLGKFEAAKKQYTQALKQQPDLKNAKTNLALINKILDAEKQQQQPKQQKNKTSGKNPPGKNSNAKSKQTDAQKKGQSPQNQADAKQRQNDSSGQQSGGNTQKGQNDLHQPYHPNTPPMNKNAATQTQQKTQKKSKKPSNQAGSDAIKANQPNKAALTDTDQKNPTAKPETKGDQQIAPTELDKQSKSKKASREVAKALAETKQAEKAWLNQIPDEPGLFLKRKFEYQYQQNQKRADDTRYQNKKW